MNCICFGINKILTPQDFVRKLMNLFTNGDTLYEVLSRYCNLSDVEGGQDHKNEMIEALITPFLAYHVITENDIFSLARKAVITTGASELVSRLNSRAWNVYCITSSYKQYAIHLTQRLNIFSQNIACTDFPLNELFEQLNKDDFQHVKAIEDQIIEHYPVNDEWIKENIFPFYHDILPGTSFVTLLKQLEPMSNESKVKALEHFSDSSGQNLSEWIAIGSSDNDLPVIRVVNKAGGLAIAFNSNKSILSQATLGLASTNLYDLWPVIELWGKGKHAMVENYVKKMEGAKSKSTHGVFHWLEGKSDLNSIAGIHREISNLI